MGTEHVAVYDALIYVIIVIVKRVHEVLYGSRKAKI